MRIGVLGFTDKRPILYPLMKLLQATGDVIVITDNRHLKRLIPDYASIGHIANIMMVISDASPDEVWDEMDLEDGNYDHVIYDLRDNLDEAIEFYIHVKGSDFEDGEEDFLECIDDYKRIKLMYDGKQDKNKETYNIPISLKLISTLEILENKKLLLPMPSKKINQSIAKMMAPHLNIKFKDAVKLLTKGWNK